MRAADTIMCQPQKSLGAAINEQTPGAPVDKAHVIVSIWQGAEKHDAWTSALQSKLKYHYGDSLVFHKIGSIHQSFHSKLKSLNDILHTASESKNLANTYGLVLTMPLSKMKGKPTR